MEPHSKIDKKMHYKCWFHIISESSYLKYKIYNVIYVYWRPRVQQQQNFIQNALERI